MSKILAKPGDLAFFDSFSGLVPCKVLAVKESSFDTYAIFRVTANRPGWKRGDVNQTGLCNVLPRKAVYRSRQVCGQYRVLPYIWALGEE